VLPGLVVWYTWQQASDGGQWGGYAAGFFTTHENGNGGMRERQSKEHMLRVSRIVRAAVAAVAAVAVTGPAAASASTLTPEAGAAPLPVRHAGLLLSWAGGTDWMGSYETEGRIVICLSPGKILTVPTSWRTGLYGSRAESAELGWLYFNGGDSSSNVTAAAARIAMLQVTGGIKYYRGLVMPAGVAAEAATLGKAMKADSGPDTRSLTFPHETTTPGQPGGAQLNVISASRHAVTGLPARFTSSGAVIGAAGRTGRPQRFTELSSPVRVTGSAQVAADTLRIGTAGELFQTLVYGLTARLSATASYPAHPAGFAHEVSCAQCGGTGNVTVTVPQAAGAAEGQYTAYADGKTQAGWTVTVPASPHGARGIITLKGVADGSVITVTARYYADRKWTVPVELGGAFTVICPASPVLTQRCLCDETLTLPDPFPAGSPYTESLVYTTPAGTFTVPVPGGTSRAVAFALASGQVTYFAEVLRGGAVVDRTPEMIGGFA